MVTEYVSEVLKDEEVVVFELNSYDVWVKVSMVLTNRGVKHNCFFEVRVCRETSISQFKLYLYKSIITMWNQIKLHEKSNLSLYFLDYVRVTQSKRQGKDSLYPHEFNPANEQGGNKDDDSDRKSGMSSQDEYELDDELYIDDYFGFKGSVNVYAEFTSLDEIYSSRSID